MKTCFLNNSTKKLWHLWGCIPCNKNPDVNNTETRDKILIAAFDEIYEKGFQASSLSNILKNTGATKGALYHHFKNKKELGLAVLDEVICESYRDTWIKPLATQDDPITFIKNNLLEYGRNATDKDIQLGSPLQNLSQEMSPIDDAFRLRIIQIYSDWQDSVEQAFERGKLAGNVILSADSKSLALIFIASLQGCISMAKATQSLDTLTCCGQALIEQVEGLRPITSPSLENKDSS
jgi:AcrR family transcriptional regulator